MYILPYISILFLIEYLLIGTLSLVVYRGTLDSLINYQKLKKILRVCAFLFWPIFLVYIIVWCIYCSMELMFDLITED